MSSAKCEAPEKGSSISLPEGFRLEVTPVTEDTKWELMPIIRPLHEKLGLSPARTEREVFYNTKEGAEVGIIWTPDDEAAGFVAQGIEEVPVGGKQTRALYIAAKVIAQDYQNHHFGTFLAQEAILRLQAEAVSGRTPNPNAIRAYELTGLVEEIYPIDKLFPYSIQTAMGLMLGIETVSRERLNLRTGRAYRVYPKGESRLFAPEELSERAREIYEKMKNPPISAELEEGDGVRYWGVVKRHSNLFVVHTTDIPEAA